MLFASCLGVFLGLLLLFFVGIFIIGIISKSSSRLPQPEEQSVLFIRLPYVIEERTSEPFENISFRNMRPARQLGLYDIVKNIQEAKEDDRIVGIYLHVDILQAGYATLKEIRDALADFQESGKFIVAHSDVFMLKSYYLASVADEVFLTPTGLFQFNGIVAQTSFFKEMLNKLDIDMQIITGPENHYKSAVESFSRDCMSPSNKEQMTILINNLWDEISTDIGLSRNRSKQEVNELAKTGTIHTDDQFISMGFIDGFLYKDQVIKIIKTRGGIPSDKKLHLVSIERYDMKAASGMKKEKQADEQIAIVYVSGEMLLGKSTTGTTGSESLAKTIRDIREDKNITAMVLRINSGGGSALAAEIIWREVALCREEKPVVVSMGDYAASGAYYIAIPADKIVATPLSITGSIGVYGMLPNMEGFFNEKLGITFDQVKNFPYADMLSVKRPLTPQEITIFQKFVSDTYDTFKQKVSSGRNLPYAEVGSLAKGRIWSASDALQYHLIDTLGNLTEAIHIAAELAQVTNYQTIERPEKPDMFEMLMKEMEKSALKQNMPNFLHHKVERFPLLQHMKNQDFIMTRIPFELDIY